jgi:uncharacterized protein (DUF305 family)
MMPVLQAARIATLAAALPLAVACSSSDRGQDTTKAVSNGSVAATPDSARPMAHDSMQHDTMTNGMSGMPPIGSMTGDADHDFLRMMSDHHKGLIQMAHMTKDKKDVGTAAQDATKLDTKQDKDLDHMATMLEKDFKDPYAPKVMPEHQQMADDLKPRSGKDYERTFYQDVIKHHQEALAMIDQYLPKAKNAMLKQMAETMKADQAKEITEFQAKVSKL